MRTLIDARWPVGTGIRRMADLYRGAAPAGFELQDLDISTRIGSPLSPIAVTRALRRQGGRQRSANMFWNPGFVPPLPGTMRSVVTVHDLIHLHFYTAAHRTYYNVVFKPLYRRCDLIVCISEFTKAEFMEWSGIGAERVVVIPNAIEPGFAALSDPLDPAKPFVFYAGNRRGYKNVAMMIKAFSAAGLPKEGFELVLTGQPDNELLQTARDCDMSHALRFTGFLDDAGLVAHYKAAACVAFISRYEGFGLPILEAWQCGTPILLADATSLPEVGGDAALYVDPTDRGAIAAGMRTLCLDSEVRQSLIAKGNRRSAMFDPAVSSAKLWGAIARVAQS